MSKKGPLDQVRKDVEEDAHKVVGFIGDLKRAFFSKCSTCGDTGVLANGTYCVCAKGHERIEEDDKHDRLPAAPAPRILPPRGGK